jgi:hypothetical protein
VTNILAPFLGKSIIDFKRIYVFLLDVQIASEDVDPPRKLTLQVAGAEEEEEERLFIDKIISKSEFVVPQ